MKSVLMIFCLTPLIAGLMMLTNGMGTAMNDESGNQEVATVAGGCFWCIEADFEKVEGVTRVVSGYTGGDSENPTYNQVCSGTGGHLEAVQVFYDPAVISYSEVLDVFWKQIDPTDPGGQFVDRGPQYASAIFYQNDEERKMAEKSKSELEESGRFDKPVATQIRPISEFYEAEEYHQDYYKKNPAHYTMYRSGSGRDQFLQTAWADGDEKRSQSQQYSRPSEAKLRESLTPLQYKVTQEEGTEPAFRNEYWDNKEDGIYVDLVSGEPLFSSRDKFKSGTGWPSFTRSLESENVVEKQDRSHFMMRTEVRSKNGDAHLGHLFPDGPEPTGMRYCINSASLRFIPKEELEKEGYGAYLKLFGE